MKKYFLLGALAVSGFLIGFLYPGTAADKNFCSGVEEKVRASQKFNGSLACYPPGRFDVNLSEKVSEESDLKCVCRIINNGGVRLYPVTESQ